MVENSKGLSAIVPISRMAGKLENLRSWIFTALDSDVQIILIHDHQDENTSKELNHLFAEVNDKNLILIEGKFGGPGMARNKGLELATGDWICFWDSDDIPNVQNVIEQIKNLKNIDVIIGSYTETDYKTGHAREKPLNQINLERNLTESPGIWRFVFRNEIAKQLKFLDSRMGEDIDFICKVRLFDKRIIICAETFYTYFVNFEGQLTRNVKAIADLHKTLLNILSIETVNLKEKEFINLIIVRMFATGIKHGSPQVKLRFILSLLKTFQVVGFFSFSHELISIAVRKMKDS